MDLSRVRTHRNADLLVGRVGVLHVVGSGDGHGGVGGVAEVRRLLGDDSGVLGNELVGLGLGKAVTVLVTVAVTMLVAIAVAARAPGRGEGRAGHGQGEKCELHLE